MGSCSLLHGIFRTQGSNPGLPHCRQILYQLRHQGSPRILEWVAFPSPGDLPNTGIEPGSHTLQAASLPAEPPGKPIGYIGSFFLHLFHSVQRNGHTFHKPLEVFPVTSRPGACQLSECLGGRRCHSSRGSDEDTEAWGRHVASKRARGSPLSLSPQVTPLNF